MKAKKTIVAALAASAAVLAFSCSASAWGKREHAAIARIAEQNLSPKAQKAINEILDGEKISSYASWLDYYKPQMLMKLTKAQNGMMQRTIPHTFHVDSTLNAYRYPEHSCATVVEESIAKLQHRKYLDDSTQFQCLLNIIHLVGDMHCPGHVIYADKRDRKIGYFDVCYKGEKIRFHKIWDSVVDVETFAGGVDDLVTLALTSSKREVKEFVRGSVYDWGSDVARRSCHIWDVQAGDDLGNTYMYDNAHLVLDLIERAGYRLAAALNEAFE